MISVQFCTIFRAEVAQLVEHTPEKRGVGSSILPLGTSQIGRILPSLLCLIPSGCVLQQPASY